MTSAAQAQNSIAKSRSDTASSEFSQTPSKPSSLATIIAVDREAGAGERRGAERQPVYALAAVGEPLRVAREHLEVGQQVVAERHRLRDLQVREAGHDRCRRAASARSSSARCAALERGEMSSIASRSHRRTSVATWSLRERAVCRRLPASPTSAVSRRSILRCTSSCSSDHSNCRCGFPRGSAPGRFRSPRGRRAENAALRASMRACASEPSMSNSREPLVEATEAVKRLHELGDRLGEAARPRLTSAVGSCCLSDLRRRVRARSHNSMTMQYKSKRLHGRPAEFPQPRHYRCAFWCRRTCCACRGARASRRRRAAPGRELIAIVGARAAAADR